MTRLVLHTKRLLLRPLKLSDLDVIHPNANDPYQTRFLASVEPPMTRKKETEWIRSTQKHWQKGTGFTFAAIRTDTGEMIGALDLLDVSRKNRRAKVGIFFYKKHWGNGFGTEAVERLVRFGFESLGLNRIEYGFLPRNRRSNGIFKRLGFKREGVQREYLFKRGRFVDHVFGSILASEWKKRDARTKKR
jgi:ribosomal-protein-alanine N-acetyltransferase